MQTFLTETYVATAVENYRSELQSTVHGRALILTKIYAYRKAYAEQTTPWTLEDLRVMDALKQMMFIHEAKQRIDKRRMRRGPVASDITASVEDLTRRMIFQRQQAGDFRAKARNAERKHDAIQDQLEDLLPAKLRPWSFNLTTVIATVNNGYSRTLTQLQK